MFLLAFIVGVALGGVLNVIIYRLPRLWPVADDPAALAAVPADAADAADGDEVVAAPTPIPASPPALPQYPLHRELHCVRGGEALTWRDSLPLLGWLLQWGRCRHCGQRLPLSFPLIELFTGLCIAIAWVDYGSDVRFFLYSAYILVLIVTMVIDWQHHDLYTIVLLIGGVLALLGAFINPDVNIDEAIWGAIVGGGIMLVFYLLARLAYGGEALAFGDVELLVMLGLMVGGGAVLAPLLFGPIVAAAVGIALVFTGNKSMRDYIPVGAAFCFATIAVLLMREQLWQWQPLRAFAFLLGQFRDSIAQWLGSLV